MKPDYSYSLISEMLETPGILRRFDARWVGPWTREIAVRQRLFLTGEGSSRIFAAKNMIDQSHRQGNGWHITTEGARQAAEYDLKNFIVMAASNSGRTKEVITLYEKLELEGITRYCVTAAPGSRLTQLSSAARVLSSGMEKAVAASKTVVEQALVFQSVLGGDEWVNQNRAADYCEAVLAQTLAPEIVASVAVAPIVYFSGRNNGVAEELALKANEIARRKSMYLEGTFALHGIEEVMQRGEAVVLVEPFRDDIEKYQKVLGQGTGVNIVAISSFDTPFPTIKIPELAGFNAYFQLLAGWNLLVAIGITSGVNIDKPERVRKIGNEI